MCRSTGPWALLARRWIAVGAGCDSDLVDRVASTTIVPMIDRNALLAHLESLLQPNMFRDYCPNGLYRWKEIGHSNHRIGVTASQALIEAAVAQR